MKKYTTYIILAIVLILIFRGCSGYNSLVREDEKVQEKWNNVETQYQRRADLIPNFVNTVKGEMKYEQETLVNTVEARYKNLNNIKIDAKNLTPENVARFQQAQGELSSALSKLMVVVERYPNLKANDGVRAFQSELTGTENRITVARKDFNAAIKSYNVKVRSFPMNLLAGMFGFFKKEGFKSEAGAEDAPEVQF